ncbi:uncharacterized protein LOC144113124 [Amblyomma americanum]|uniref:Uncharacterized protein n=1 Tax=Amblyomma americanum TaxID=6943 RepID=A0AAQ4FBL0_AMBAM
MDLNKLCGPWLICSSDSDEPVQPYAHSIHAPPTPPNAARLMNGSEDELAMPVVGGHCSEVMKAKQPPVLQFRKTAKRQRTDGSFSSKGQRAVKANRNEPYSSSTWIWPLSTSP